MLNITPSRIQRRPHRGEGRTAFREGARLADALTIDESEITATANRLKQHMKIGVKK